MDNNDIKKQLNSEKMKINLDIEVKKKKFKDAILLSSLLFICGLVLIISTSYSIKMKDIGNIQFIILICIGTLFFTIGANTLLRTYFFKNNDVNILMEKLIYINEDIELLEYDKVDYEKRAEIQFKQHQKELKRYYDINIDQMKVVLPLGITILIMGIVIICLTIYLFKNNGNAVPIIIGCISGILIDFIGAVFINMYIQTIKASTEFHNKLIGSNNNLFANVLVTKISDEKLRNEAFAEIAKIISNGNNIDNKQSSK